MVIILDVGVDLHLKLPDLENTKRNYLIWVFLVKGFNCIETCVKLLEFIGAW